MIAVQLMILGNFELTSEKVAMGQNFCCAQTLMLFNINYEVLFVHSKFFETIEAPIHVSKSRKQVQK